MKKVEDYVVSIPDFPEKGIIFRDVTSVIQDKDGLQLAIDEMQALLDGVEFDVILGAESRGFIFGMPIAYNLKKGFVPVRKKGKLPRETVSAKYELEYGIAEIEIHKDAIEKVVESFVNINLAIRRDSYIYSMSETYQSNPLWAFYCNNNQGFCIEYNFNNF